MGFFSNEDVRGGSFLRQLDVGLPGLDVLGIELALGDAVAADVLEPLLHEVVGVVTTPTTIAP